VYEFTAESTSRHLSLTGCYCVTVLLSLAVTVFVAGAWRTCSSVGRLIWFNSWSCTC